MSISQTTEVPTLAGSFITLEMVRAPVATRNRRTKIICGIGPACWEVEQLEAMMDAGMNVARLNFSHGDHASHAAVLDRIRQAANNKQKNIAVLLETKGPEIRTGMLADGKKTIELQKGQTLVLTNNLEFLGNEQKISCSYAQLAKSVQPGQVILAAGGDLVLTVTAVDETIGEVTCRVEATTSLGENKKMHLPGVIVDLPTFTEQDVDDIVNFAIPKKVEFIAASFIRKAADVTNLRQLLAENGGQDIKIISKIENQEGLNNYAEILQVTDAVMVARGDLGMEIPPQKVFLAQKLMIREANIAGKPVVTATQMLESMLVNPRPTRAECGDIANAVLDGSDAVMLSGETANGPNFEQAIRVMAQTCSVAESCRNYNALYSAIRSSTIDRFKILSNMESLASSAVKTAIDVSAALIVVLSESGNTARCIAKYRPGCTIVCLTNRHIVARQVNGLYKGVHSFVLDEMTDDPELTQEIGAEAVAYGIAKPGDLMVIVSGTLQGKGQNNQVRVEPIVLHEAEGKKPATPTIKRLSSFAGP